MGIKRAWSFPVVVGVLAMIGSACTFSPQTARQAATGITVQRVEIASRQWTMTPNQVRVKVNTTVEFVVTSVDVDHGIEFTDLDVPLERVPAGRTVTVKFIPDKVGTYHFRCAVVCGTGHDQMVGTLVVE